MQKSRDPEHFVDSFRGRLQALSRAPDLYAGELVRRRSSITNSRSIADRSGTRISASYSGPRLGLQPRAAVHLGLVLHELGTNARKYGALKAAEGKLAVTWRIAARQTGSSIELTWEERAGPAVSPPASEGFGTFLIQRGLKHALGGEAHVTFAPAGVVCKLRLPFRSCPHRRRRPRGIARRLIDPAMTDFRDYADRRLCFAAQLDLRLSPIVPVNRVLALVPCLSPGIARRLALPPHLPPASLGRSRE